MQKYVVLNILRLTYFLILKRRALTVFSLVERSFTWYSQLRFVKIFTPKYLTLLVGYCILPHSFISSHLPGADVGGCHCCQCSTLKWLTVISRVQFRF